MDADIHGRWQSRGRIRWHECMSLEAQPWVTAHFFRRWSPRRINCEDGSDEVLGWSSNLSPHLALKLKRSSSSEIRRVCGLQQIL